MTYQQLRHSYHVCHKSTNMAGRDVTAAGGHYNEANLEEIDKKFQA